MCGCLCVCVLRSHWGLCVYVFVCRGHTGVCVCVSLYAEVTLGCVSAVCVCVC